MTKIWNSWIPLAKAIYILSVVNVLSSPALTCVVHVYTCSLLTRWHLSLRWPVASGSADSIYLKLWRWNHCNHRDYQNLAKNGADSFDMNEKLLPSMARNQYFDQPALVFYSLVGNDVCKHFHDIRHMTTPEEMHVNVLKTLDRLDDQLPSGSHVVLVGLADGRVFVQ